jgi:hypothetical protein
MGLVGQYRWGAERKHLLLAWEGARHAGETGAGPAAASA